MAIIRKHGSSLLLLLLLGILLLCNMPAPCASKKSKPEQLDFYMLVIPQNLSMLDNPTARYTAVRSGAPPTPQDFSFGVLNTFDNLISKAPSLDNPTADVVGRVQGWYGDCGQDQLTLCLAQTFTYDDGNFKGTFSLVGVSIATAPLKEAAIVGGTGDFAFCRGVAAQHLISTTSINFEENAWFQYAVTFKC